MGPNSGGGRKNKGQPNVSTRARFSRAPKNLVDKFQKRGKGKDGLSRNNDRPSSETVGPVVKEVPANKKQLEEKGLGRINIPQKLLSQLLLLLGEPPSEATSQVTNSACTEVKKEEKQLFSLIMPSVDRPQSHSTHQSLQYLQKKFDRFGFYTFEFDASSDINDSATDNEQFLRLLMATRQHNILPRDEIEVKSTPTNLISDDLGDEIEALSSIFGSDIYHEGFLAFGYVSCCKISVSITPCDVRYEVCVFIFNSCLYPRLDSKLYGWLVDPAIHSSKEINRDCLNVKAIRTISLDAMETIQNYHSSSESPVVYDFVQNISDALAAYFSSLDSQKESQSQILSDDSPMPLNKAFSDAAKNSNLVAKSCRSKTSQNVTKNGTCEVKKQENPCNATETKAAKLPPMPVTFHIRSSEYRSAFSAGLSKGLNRSDAQELALQELEYIFPDSTLKELRDEIDYEEAKLNKAFSASKDISTREVIEGTKVLSEKLQINKAASKGLYLEAKRELVLSGDEYARTIDILKKRIIDRAAGIQFKRIAKRKEKQAEKSKQKQDHVKVGGRVRPENRGLTIRDAYEIAENSKRQGPTGDLYYDSAMNESSDELKEENVDPYAHSVRVNACKVEQKNNEVLESTFHSSLPPNAKTQCNSCPIADNFEKDNDFVEAATDGLSTTYLESESKKLLNSFKNKKLTATYKDWLRKRQRLPAYQMKSEILRAIDSNSVVVISGDTGCGKTTQIPQLVLDAFIEKGCGALCNIIVTQPRRISAVSVAEQVARERAEKLGMSVGYQIRLESVKSSSTRLLLMTTGVLLRKLQTDDCNLEGLSHVFVDEVHERDMNTDFLLVVLKKMLSVNPHIKIVLMSATLNSNLFFDYFQDIDSINCDIVNIPGRAFPVTQFYLEDVLEQTNHEITSDSEYAVKAPVGKREDKRSGQTGSAVENVNRQSLRERFAKEEHIAAMRKLKKYKDRTLNSLLLADENVINLELIQKLVLHILAQDGSVNSDENVGAILIFVPGLGDIRNVIDKLKMMPEITNPKSNVSIFPLHSSLTCQEQSRVFQILPNKGRKIIVSTNIAETSVTIEDVVYVIDTCRVKVNTYDNESQLNVLQEEFISQASARQRRGRAGRVRSGVCFHLVSQFTLDNLPSFTTPEMLRMSLEDLILQILALELGDPYVFLSEAISPPEQCSVSNALIFLDSLNAVRISATEQANASKKAVHYQSEITPLGFHLAALPISPRLGKLMLYGVLLKCVDPILTIISTVSAKSPFVSPFDQREQADQAKQNFILGNSDLLSAMEAYNSWKTSFGSQKNGTSDYYQQEYMYCRSNFLSLNSLKLIDQMRGQFLQLLKDIGFIDQSVKMENIGASDENKNGSSIFMIKCTLCAGLSPNILMVPGSAIDKKEKLNKKLMEVALLSGRKGHNVKVHPSSIMSEIKKIDHPFITYLEVVKTSNVYVRDVTTLSPIVLALFCGKLSANLNSGVVVVNNWLTFRSVPEVSRCLIYVRDEIEDTFTRKVLNPGSPQPSNWDKVLKILKQL